MASSTLVSVEQYLASVYEPDCEYVDGEIIERNMGELEHGGLQGLIVHWLLSRRKQLGIHVFPETRTQVLPTRYRVPDIAVTTKRPSGRILREPPLLCIEILSPEDRASRMEDKIDDYLNFGVPYIWLIDPQRKCAWLYTREGSRQQVSVLTTGNPRIELSLAELFRELSEEVDPE
jgi:Uma2 family endonuclease